MVKEKAKSLCRNNTGLWVALSYLLLELEKHYGKAREQRNRAERKETKERKKRRIEKSNRKGFLDKLSVLCLFVSPPSTSLSQILE